jgi:hypothetical protein
MKQRIVVSLALAASALVGCSPSNVPSAADLEPALCSNMEGTARVPNCSFKDVQCSSIGENQARCTFADKDGAQSTAVFTKVGNQWMITGF